MIEKLGKYYNVISGFAFKSSDLKDNADIPIIKIGNISNGKNVIIENMQYVDHEFLNINEKYHIKNGDVLISLTGSHINQPNSMVGRICRNYDKQTYLLNQRAGKIIAKENASTDYMFYALLTKAMKESIVSRAYGAANQVNVSPSAIMSIKWNFPTLPTQQKIASILSAYDRLIENNTRRIRLLEQMAENLYKEWFVRFRFPEHEKVEMVNGLPKGWKVEKLGKYANISTGKCNREDAEEDGIFPLFDRSQEIKKSSKWIKDCEAIIVPGEGTSFMPRYYKGKFNLHQRCYCIEPTIKDIGFYLFYSIMLNRKYFLSVATGATVPSLRQNNFTKMKLVIAEFELVKKYNKIASTIALQIDRLKEQNTLLTRQRDLLLPRLMSGKLEVKS